MASALELLLLSRSQVVPNVQVFTTTGTSTWTKPGGAIWVQVEVQAAGGSSSGVAATAAATVAHGGSGAGGEYARGVFAATALTDTVTVTVGAGGAAPAAGDNAGNVGGSSSFGTYITCVGGAGGNANGTVANNVSASFGGSNGGTGGTGGDFRINGGDSSNSQVINGFALRFCNGGDSFMSANKRATGIAASGSTSGGFAGYKYGGGASAPWNGVSQAAVAGSAGAQGIVVVTTYFMA